MEKCMSGEVKCQTPRHALWIKSTISSNTILSCLSVWKIVEKCVIREIYSLSHHSSSSASFVFWMMLLWLSLSLTRIIPTVFICEEFVQTLQTHSEMKCTHITVDVKHIAQNLVCQINLKKKRQTHGGYDKDLPHWWFCVDWRMLWRTSIQTHCQHSDHLSCPFHFHVFWRVFPVNCFFHHHHSTKPVWINQVQELGMAWILECLSFFKHHKFEKENSKTFQDWRCYYTVEDIPGCWGWDWLWEEWSGILCEKTNPWLCSRWNEWCLFVEWIETTWEKQKHVCDETTHFSKKALKHVCVLFMWWCFVQLHHHFTCVWKTHTMKMKWFSFQTLSKHTSC